MRGNVDESIDPTCFVLEAISLNFALRLDNCPDMPGRVDRHASTARAAEFLGAKRQSVCTWRLFVE